MGKEKVEVDDMSHTGFILHGAVLYSKNPEELLSYSDAYLVCVDGFSCGVFQEIPSEYTGLPVTDFWDKVIIPGMTDLHVRAPYYQIRGLGLSKSCNEWMNAYAYPEEEKYGDAVYAARAYDLFVEDLYIGATTRAVVCGTVGSESTVKLMDLLEDSGIVSCVGRACNDREVPQGLRETLDESLLRNRNWVRDIAGKYERTYPVLAPRSMDTCSPELLKGIGADNSSMGIPVTIQLTGRGQTDVLMESGLLDSAGEVLLTGASDLTEEELGLLRERDIFLAHCPLMERATRSGHFPVRRCLQEGISVGMGSDLEGMGGTSIFDAMRQAVLEDDLSCQADSHLTFEEVFYMATRGGGAFFGDVGSFDPGSEFDAVVIDDSNQDTMLALSPRDRIERLLICADDRNVVGKYIRGAKIY